MKKILTAMLLLVSSTSFASPSAFICSDNIDEKRFCNISKRIQKHLTSYSLKGELTPLIHKKVYIEQMILINRKITMNTVFSEGVDSNKLADQAFTKNTLHKVFNKVCNDKNYRMFIESGGTIDISFSLQDKSKNNVPKKIFLNDCKKEPNYRL